MLGKQGCLFVLRFCSKTAISVLNALVMCGLIALPRPARAVESMESLEAFIDGITAAHMDDLSPTATVVAVVHGDESFAKGYGIADLETGRGTDDTTLFRIGSISKTFIWLSVMILVDEGKIDLNEDVNTYLSKLQIPNKFGIPVTMNHLMAHRGGFEDTFEVFFDPNRTRDFEDSLIDNMPEQVAKPGLRTSYSNWGANVAALVVQNVSGMPFDQFVRKRILDPLEMVSTTLHDPAAIVPVPLNDSALDARMAKPYKHKKGGPELTRYLSVEPEYTAGAVALDGRDAIRYMRMLLDETRYDGGQLLSEECFALLRTRAFNDRPNAPDLAHGFMESSLGDLVVFGHGGGTAFLSTMMLIPELDLGVFVSVNSNDREAYPGDYVRMIALRVAGRSWDTGAMQSANLSETEKTITGTYLPNRRAFSTMERITGLANDITIALRDDGTATCTASGKTRRLYHVDNDVWEDISGDRVFAYRDTAGQVVRISTASGSMTAERVDYWNSTKAVLHSFACAALFSATTLLGLLWRYGREVPSTPLGHRFGQTVTGTAVLWLVSACVLAWAMTQIGSADLAQLQDGQYPPPSLWVIFGAFHATAIASGLVILSVIPMWCKSGWPCMRKIHFSLYAVTLIAAVIQMAKWNLIGALPYDL